MLVHSKITIFLSRRKNHVDITSNTSLKLQFPRKLNMEFWVGIEVQFPHLSRKSLNILHPFTVSCVQLDFQQQKPSKQSSSYDKPGK
jgi:hypothetical protein